ncbi:MAG: hypothetical protein KC502_15580 [Myxococcales bacterium]|nr:hypothetical protein [Myxococcales bacterium]
MTTSSPIKRRWWPVAAAVALVLLSMGVRSTNEQVSAFDKGVASEKSGDIEDAIVSYRWALRWYTPWGPNHADAAVALRKIADEATQARPARAVRALDALRSGLLASRSLFQPRAADLTYANQTIPALLVRVAERKGDKRPKAKLLARFTADYARPVGVPGWLSLLVSLGFLLWMGGLVMTWHRGVGEDGRWQRAGWPWAGAAVGGFVVWTLAMWLG